jgi:hypothetical protein
MRGPHRFHTSTLLTNGKVLVSGGYIGGTSITNGAELYDPVSGTWTATGSILTNAKKLPNGASQFGFTNTPGAVFTALAATNVALPLSNWTALTGVTEISSGQFQFTDTQATNYPHRFYRGRSP